MHPTVALETCPKYGCGGVAVSVPKGSVYDGNDSKVVYCVRCMEDKIALLQDRPSQERLDALSRHYWNEKLYNFKLRDALQKIADACVDDGVNTVAFYCEDIAKAALAAAPPQKSGSTWPAEDGGFYTGHVHPEYLDLPMKLMDEYIKIP